MFHGLWAELAMLQPHAWDGWGKPAPLDRDDEPVCDHAPACADIVEHRMALEGEAAELEQRGEEAQEAADDFYADATKIRETLAKIAPDRDRPPGQIEIPIP